MNLRRFFATVVALTWLSPAMVASGVAVHVAFEHAHELEHGAAPARTPCLRVPELGQVHSADHLAHEHSAALAAGDAAIRRAPGSNPQPSVAISPRGSISSVAIHTAGLASTPHAPPPRASGPPLLSRLSTFRI